MMTDIMRYKKIGDYYTKFAASLGESVGALTAKQKADALSTYAVGGAVELKPCPFCGNIPVAAATQNKKTCYTEFRVICFSPYCSVDGPMRTTEEEAINAWNTRRAQWVAVSERQPEVLQDVLLITKYKRVIMGYRDQNASGIFITFSANYPINDITHWLPLDWLPLPETADK